MKCGVYKIRNEATGRCYIGSAVVFKRRLSDHRKMLERGDHPNRYLQSAWAKYGAKEFTFSIVLICEPIALLMYEQLLIDAHASQLYNLSPKAGSQLGFRHSEEAKQRMAKLKIGKKASDAHRAAISEALQGHAVSDRVISVLQKRRGTKLSPEWRAKLSAAKKGKRQSPEAVAKRARANTGKKRSPEQRARISAGLRQVHL